MILTLKMVGVAFEIHDTKRRREKAAKEGGPDEEERLVMKYKDVEPSALDIFHYAFSHAGLLTGSKIVHTSIVEQCRKHLSLPA